MNHYAYALAALSVAACSSLSRAERVKYGLEAIRGACALYQTYPTEVPREPELDEVCRALAATGAE